MNNFLKSFLFAVTATFLVANGAMATPLFFDNFDTENNSSGVSNYDTFNNWTVDLGSVDLVGGGYWEWLAKDGLSVDLDGSTGDAGRLTSVDINVIAGQTYTFSFDISGNQRNALTDSVVVGVYISDYYETFTLSGTDSWQTISREVTVYKDFVNIVFNHDGNDNIGIVLDNVSFDASPVPEPTTMLLFGTGLIGLAGFARRKNK